MKWFKDLLYGPGNEYFDLGRLLAFIAVGAMAGGAGWNVWLGLPVDLGPGGLGGGLAAVLTGGGALIYAKDRTSAPVALASPPPPPCPQEGKPKPRAKRKVVKK